MPKNEVVNHFPDTDMRNGHAGLIKIAKEHNKDPKNLKRREFLLFTNTRNTVFKLFASETVVVHYKSPDNSKIDPATFRLFPRYFNGTGLNYKGALKERINKYFKEKGLIKVEE